MAPRKGPPRLSKICINSTLNMINTACYAIEKSCPVDNFDMCQSRVHELKKFLIELLPVRLFDILCLERMCCVYRGDPRVLLHVLIHPNMTVFRKCDLDNVIKPDFWTQMIPLFNCLLVLDMKFVCTDDILKVVGSTCYLLEELNIVSRVDIHKSPINASVMIRNVSDTGLCYLKNLKNLKILYMDAPRNERISRVGRYVTQTGIIRLVSQLPVLEELRIESCDVGSTLLSTNLPIGPLALRKVRCHFSSADRIQKLSILCPQLQHLSLTHLSTNDKDAIVEQITSSVLNLHKLDMSFFSYSESIQRLLTVKGNLLTHFSLWEVDQSINCDAIMAIGQSCPNLFSFCLITQSMYLRIPAVLQRPPNLFGKLSNLVLGNDNYDIENVVDFFLDCARNLERLVIKYQTKLNMDDALKNLIRKGSLSTVTNLWLDCTLEVSLDVAKALVRDCDKIHLLTMDIQEYGCDLQQYIITNNFDVILGAY